MLLATLAMWLACVGVQYLPIYPSGAGKISSAAQLLILMALGGGVYFAAAALLGLGGEMRLFGRRARSS
jgi:hypothetical protein